MRSDVKRDLSDSAYDFKRLVWPEGRLWIGGGELIHVESVTDSEFAKRLDILAGIDAWQAIQDKGIRGIASRIQWYKDKYYRSLTIRAERKSGAETELPKRLRAIKTGNGWLIPEYTFQGYVIERRKGELIYMCMVRTTDLYKYVDWRIRNGKPLKKLFNPLDGNLFHSIWVEDLKAFGIDIKEYRNRELILRLNIKEINKKNRFNNIKNYWENQRKP